MNTPWDPLQKSALWKKYLDQDTLSADRPYERFCVFFSANSAVSVYEAELSRMRSYNQSITPINNNSWKLYYFVCISGAIYALCSGFDGMFSVLSVIFPQLYLGLLVGFCVLSALCALGIFIARDKPSVLDALELPSKESCSVVDEYIFSLQRYMHQQSESLLDSEKPFNVEDLKISATHLGNILANKKEINRQIQQTWNVWLQSSLVVFIGCLLYFSDGFFIGQNVACLFISSSLMLSVCISAAIGVCALAAYWCVERKSLQDYLNDELFTDQKLTVTKQNENFHDYRIMARENLRFSLA